MTELEPAVEVKKKGTPLPPAGTAERAEYFRIKMAESRARKKKAKEAKPEADCKIEIDEEEARRILTEERLIRHPHVLDKLIQLADVAAQQLKIPKNQHFYRHGVQRTLGNHVDIPGDIWLPGERIRQHELFALWDYSTSWRTQKDDSRIDFAEFKRLRRICQTDTFEFGVRILQKDFVEQPHKRWCKELFVQRNPDLLPEIVTQSAMSDALRQQSDIHRRMLLAGRNSFKSSVDTIDLVGWVCTFPDIRILVCSSTSPLAKGFIRSFRSFFIVRNLQEPTLFQQLWPEMTVGADTSVMNYLCPMRQLELIQPTVQATSAQSEGQAGERADYIVYEDICEQTNVTTVEQRQKVIDTYLLLNELLEPNGFIQICGTPWSAPSMEGTGDLYNSIVKQEEASDEKEMLYVIDPSWRVKAGVNKLPYDLSLTEDEVELLFPERLTFKYLRSKLRASVKTFRQQQLCEWVPDADDQIKIHFDPDVLSSAVINANSVPAGQTILSVDIATSLSSRADLSSIAAIRLFENAASEKCMCTLDIEAERLRGSELAYKLVDMTRTYKPSIVLIEKGPSSDGLRAQIDAWGKKYDTIVPYHFVQASNIKNRKFLAIKDLELLLAQGRLKFRSGAYIDALFLELSRISGVQSSVRKDDRADAIAQAATVFKIYSAQATPEAKKDDGEMEKMEHQMRLKQHHARYFSDIPYLQPVQSEQQQPQQNGPRQSMFNILPDAMRRR